MTETKTTAETTTEIFINGAVFDIGAESETTTTIFQADLTVIYEI